MVFQKKFARLAINFSLNPKNKKLSVICAGKQLKRKGTGALVPLIYAGSAMIESLTIIFLLL